jgi:hypothetical protein
MESGSNGTSCSAARHCRWMVHSLTEVVTEVTRLVCILEEINYK